MGGGGKSAWGIGSRREGEGVPVDAFGLQNM